MRNSIEADSSNYPDEEPEYTDEEDDDYDDLIDWSELRNRLNALDAERSDDSQGFSSSEEKPDEDVDFNLNITELKQRKQSKSHSLPTQPQPESMSECDLPSLEKEVLSHLTVILHNDDLYYYNGHCYSILRDGKHLMGLYRSIVRYDLKNLRNIRVFDQLYDYMLVNPTLIPKNYEYRLNEAKHLVTLRNGVFDIQYKTLYDHDRRFLTFNELDANYTEKKPRAFRRFLSTSCGDDEEIIRRTKEVLGYLFSNNNEAKLFFVIGTAPDSGKSTLASLIQKVVGDDSTSFLAPHKLGDRFSLGNIMGVSVNLAMDVPNGKLKANAVSMLKSITGKDGITIERKYKDPRSHVCNTRFLFGTNYPITVPKDANEDAFWNRMCIIPFEISIPDEEKDPDLLDDLYDERDEIVSMCLRNYSRVFNQKNKFSECLAADRMKESWRRGDSSNASALAFWNDEILLTGDEAFLTGGQIYEAYEQYCDFRGYHPIAYKLLIAWIKDNANPQLCRSTRKRIYGSNSNPVHGFQGIRFRYENREEDNS